MSVVVEDDAKPRIGYKQVVLPNGNTGIAKIVVPDGEVVVRTPYFAQYRSRPSDAEPMWLYRAGSVRVMSIVNTSTNEMVAMGFSKRNPGIVYRTGKITASKLDKVSDKGVGLHFFSSEAAARIWFNWNC